ncbi:hypothetical protein BJ170DRAFT_588980 [Xylariales sp. AK1849]|nr:hypothetical protein BJ170DRAFT_588980 [Xylariales sp. AK1849]
MVAALARDRLLHLRLLSNNSSKCLSEQDILVDCPLFTPSAVRNDTNSRSSISQYGLLAAISPKTTDREKLEADTAKDHRVFYNTTTPSSTFILGSQGSGKSHTLSCLLENCLVASSAAVLPSPLSALVFHYDTFVSDNTGTPCEAAFLSSLTDIHVRVVCSPTNISTVKRVYESLDVIVEPLQIDSHHLNTKRMLDLMAVNPEDGGAPLYVQVVHRILRDMRISQQASGGHFDYDIFKTHLQAAELTPAQLGPLNQRLAVLESFMPRQSRSLKGKKASRTQGTSWSHEPGTLTIVDLSCPCITPEAACSFFNICLSIFLEQDMVCGRVIALDEAHKYMNTSHESLALTNTLLSSVRLQRHLGVRILVSTQEPTISPALLDLCSMTIVHRFTSPSWLKTLRAHIALPTEGQGKSPTDVAPMSQELFEDVVGLRTGEALIFAPSAVIAWECDRANSEKQNWMLGRNYIKVRIRARLSADGGKSIRAE